MLLALGVALLVGVGGPVLDVTVKCQRSRARILAICPTPGVQGDIPCPATSEACVWGKSLLPLSIGITLVILGIPAALLTYWWAGRRGTAPPSGP